jgi:diaminopimelate decarboxylase
VEPYIAALSAAIVDTCRARGLDLPHLVLEPGRSLVAPAAVALYTVGARKEIPGVRTYIAVDGGMADNIRPALYGAKYAARQIASRKWQIADGKSQMADDESANQRISEPTHSATNSRFHRHAGFLTNHAARSTQHETITIAGKFCESGDILIRDMELPRLEAGDLLAIPMAGAYTLAMASNYNLARRPAVVLVKDGAARLIQRRETYADLVARDLPLHAEQP